MKKAAVIVLSDPKTGSEESLGRLFNALAAVYGFKQRGDDVQPLFQGAGTRWAGELVNKEHPTHELFAAVKDKVAGVSCGCADVFRRARRRGALRTRSPHRKCRSEHHRITESGAPLQTKATRF